MTKTPTRTTTTIYWAATLFVAFIMTISGALALIHAPSMMSGLAHLGYPPYFSNLLGVSKLTGVCVLLLPGVARLKEWAYAGFGITVLSASYSHLLSGDGLLALRATRHLRRPDPLLHHASPKPHLFQTRPR